MGGVRGPPSLTVILGLDPRIGLSAYATLARASSPLRSILGSSPRMTAVKCGWGNYLTAAASKADRLAALPFIQRMATTATTTRAPKAISIRVGP